MIFSIQHHLEDHLNRRGLTDVDQYAVKIANLYDRSRAARTQKQFLVLMGRIRTAFFSANRNLNRLQFETALLNQLDKRFQKKNRIEAFPGFPGGVAPERARLQREPRRSIASILAAFKHAFESRAIDTLWVSRKSGQLQPRPEKIAQGLLAMFAKGVIGDNGLVQREISSGIGFVDMSIVLSASVPHLIELKILKGVFHGASQLETYMANEKRKEGWLLLFDTRPSTKKVGIPASVACSRGTIRVLVIEINPTAPCRR